MARSGNILFTQLRLADVRGAVLRVALALAVIVALIAAAGVSKPRETDGRSHAAGAIAVAQASGPADAQEQRPADAPDRDLSQDTSAERGPLDDAVLASAAGIAVAAAYSKARHAGADHALPGSATRKPPFEPPRA